MNELSNDGKHLFTNSNVALECFINSMVCEGVITEETAKKMSQYQMIVVNKSSFVDRFKAFFGFTDEDDTSNEKFVCVKICGYDPDEQEDDDMGNEDDDSFLKRIGIK